MPTPPPGRPTLDVGTAVGYGWKKFTDHAAAFVLLMLAAFLAYVIVGAIRYALIPDGYGFTVWLWSSLVGALAYVATSIVQAGVIRGGLAATRGQEPDPSMLTDTTNIAPFILTNLIIGAGLFIGLLLCLIPGIIWLVLTFFAPIQALDKGTDPIEAISMSFNWVKDRFGELFPILLVSLIVYIAGACFFGVGLLISAPVALVTLVYTYRVLNNEPVVA